MLRATPQTSSITTGAAAKDVYLKYRGIENHYGHIWKWIDGFNVNNNIPYLCNTIANFADDTAIGYTRPVDILGTDITMINSDGYQNFLAKYGRAFLPTSVASPADGSHKITDYYLQSTGWLGRNLGVMLMMLLMMGPSICMCLMLLLLLVLLRGGLCLENSIKLQNKQRKEGQYLWVLCCLAGGRRNLEVMLMMLLMMEHSI